MKYFHTSIFFTPPRDEKQKQYCYNIIIHKGLLTAQIRLGLYKLFCSTVAPVALEGLSRIIRVAPRAVE